MILSLGNRIICVRLLLRRIVFLLLFFLAFFESLVVVVLINAVEVERQITSSIFIESKLFELASLLGCEILLSHSVSLEENIKLGRQNVSIKAEPNLEIGFLEVLLGTILMVVLEGLDAS